MIKKGFIVFCICLIAFNSVFINSVSSANYHWAGNSAQNVAQILRASKVQSSEYKNFIGDNQVDKLISNITLLSNIEKLTTAADWYKILSVIFDIDVTEKVNDVTQNQLITREEAISYLMKQIINNYGKPENIKSEYFKKFKDLNKLNLGNTEYMKIALKEGIISGYDDSSIRPKDFLRNAEAVSIIARICGWYQLPQSQWNDNIKLVKENNLLTLSGIDVVNDASWASDNSIIFTYNNPDTFIREASKLNVDKNSSVVAFKYDKSNISLSFLNRTAFENERGYISANDYIWTNMKKYVNGNGQLKEIQVPYTNYWISENKEKILIQNNKEKKVKIFDFINEKEVHLEDYYYWADSNYSRSIKWSPNGKYIICNLFKPEDDIGIGIKNKFAVFNSETGKLVKIIMNYDSYSYYPVWSPDSKKIAFLRVDIDNNDLQYALSNMIESSFNLPATTIGIYNLEMNQINYYEYADSIIYGKYENSIIWSPDSTKVYFESALNKMDAIYRMNKELELNVEEIPNKITMLDLSTGYFKDITIGGQFTVNPSDIWFEDEEPVNYVVTKQLLSVSPDNNRIFYKKTFNNTSYYENVNPKYSLLDLNVNKEFEISDATINDYWWLANGNFIYVKSELPKIRRAQITFSINVIDNELSNKVLSTYTQYGTKITISPNKKYLMIYDYRGAKQIKIIKLS